MCLNWFGAKNISGFYQKYLAQTGLYHSCWRSMMGSDAIGLIGLITAMAVMRKTNGEWIDMMTSSNGSFLRVTGHLCGEFTGHRWIRRTKASDAELWCFLWSAPLIIGWVNNREAGDFRRHCDHYDAIVINYKIHFPNTFSNVLQLLIWDIKFSWKWYNFLSQSTCITVTS